MAQGLLDRDTYRKVKQMNKDQMEDLMQHYYNLGRESVSSHVLDMESLRNDIGKVRGVGESRLNEIMEIINIHLGLNAESNV